MLIEQTIVETRSGKITTTYLGQDESGVIETVTVVLETLGTHRVSGSLIPARYSTHEHFRTRQHRCWPEAKHDFKAHMTLAQAVEDYQDRISKYTNVEVQA